MDNTDVLALKYRPRKFSEVIGQDAPIQALTNAFNSGQLPQTFIFAGAFGCGKTTVARILAAMENCEVGRNLEPCGECKLCRQIFDGEATDVREINAAQNRGIDDIRDMEKFVAGRPVFARVKYVILDECHMLSKDAFEAALKMFEEPPDGVRYVLCTTDPHKMKGTIQSRLMPFRIVKVPWPLTSQHLRYVAIKEKIIIDDAAVKIAAKLADGSVRSALRNLQLLRMYAGEKAITVESAQIALGAIDDSNYFDLTDSIVKKEASTGIKIIASIFNKGIDFEQVFNGILDHLRTLMVILTCSNTTGLIYLSDEEKQRYVRQVGALKQGLSITGGDLADHFITKIMSHLYDVARGVALNISPQTLLERFAVQSMVTFGELERQAAEVKKSKGG